MRLVLKAPAKINLFLRITGRRRDGYHLLDSVFLPIDLCDRVEVKVLPRSVVEVSCPDFPNLQGPNNLAWRAAELYIQKARWPKGAEITIRKKIPVAAGLGGASSDAATVLRALDSLNPSPLGRKILHSLAVRLGADVPFFLVNQPCRVTGVGEKLQLIRISCRPWVVLACAPFGLLTREVYVRYDEMNKTPSPKSIYSKKQLTSQNDDAIKLHPVQPDGVEFFSGWSNDLQPAAENLAPVIKEVISILQRAGLKTARLTGSGPTVFALCRTKIEARKATGCARLPEGWKTMICRVLSTGGAQRTH